MLNKFVVVLMMVLTLGCANGVSAMNGRLLDMEEEFVSMFVERGDYRLFAPLLSDSVKNDLDEKTYKEFKKQVADQCGKLTVFKMRNYQKMDDADVLHYETQFAKDKKQYIYEFAFDVSGGKPLLVNFELVTLEEAPAQPAK